MALMCWNTRRRAGGRSRRPSSSYPTAAMIAVGLCGGKRRAGTAAFAAGGGGIAVVAAVFLLVAAFLCRFRGCAEEPVLAGRPDLAFCSTRPLSIWDRAAHRSLVHFSFVLCFKVA